MKKWMIVAMAVVLAIAAVSVTAYSLEHRHVKTLQRQVGEQSEVIDSLLRRRQTCIDVDLYVTDKSRNYVYGRYNKGTITMPQERKYILEIDSTSMVLR